MPKVKSGYYKWIAQVLVLLVYSQISGNTIAEGTYVDPTVVVEVSCGDTYKYGDQVEVTVLVENADNYSKYGEDSFTATQRSYIIKAGATGVTWHYTYNSGYEEQKGPEDFDIAKTITREPIKIEFRIDWYAVDFAADEPTLSFYVAEQSVDPEVPYAIEWSEGSEEPIQVGPGDVVFAEACLVLQLDDYDGPGGKCDSKTFDYDDAYDGWEDEQQDNIDRDDDCQQEGNDGAGPNCPLWILA